MADTLLRDKARVLRSRGASLNEITHRLKVPKSTVRYWCRDIELSDAQQQQIFHKQKLGGIKAAELMRRQRLLRTRQLVNQGKKEIGRLSPRELLLIGAALYWAEGYRKGDGEFGFTNSDPSMVKFMVRWLKEACGVQKDRIHLRLCLNAAHRPRVDEIEKFWAEVTRIPRSQFSKPTLIRARHKKQYLNPSAYFGMLRIKVRQSTNFRRKIVGWIEGISSMQMRQ